MGAEKNLRQQIENGKMIIAPGVHDALTAAIVSKCGFPAIYLSSQALVTSLLGKSDVALLMPSEILTATINIVETVEIPVIVDVGAVLDNEQLIYRAVRTYQKIGAAAIQLSDYTKARNLPEEERRPRRAMIDHIKAAADARGSSGLLIVAETSARTTSGIGAAIDLAGSYVEAGADVIFIDSPKTSGEMKFINESINAYTMTNIGLCGDNLTINSKQLKSAGYNIVVYPDVSIGVTVSALVKQLSALETMNTIETEIMFEMLSEF